MGDEQGLEEETPHTHLYIHCATAMRFSTVKRAFPPAHIEECRGTAQENRDYIAKEGKWMDDDKHGTRIDGTFEEWGELPIERQGMRTDLSELYEMIKEGLTHCEIYEHNPDLLRYHTLIEQVRQDHRFEEYREKQIDKQVYYIWGETGVGKTRKIYDTFCANEIYRVTDYKHPFDAYSGERVLVFDEFRSQVRISDMLNYLDRYPIKLPSRYVNKQACYNTVYILSNWPLKQQYHEVQTASPSTWKSFLRRISGLYEMTEGGVTQRHDVERHIAGYEWHDPGTRFVELDEQEELPF
jgi:hypothetical protein